MSAKMKWITLHEYEQINAKCAKYEKALDEIRMMGNPGRSREEWMIFARATDALKESGELTGSVRQPNGQKEGE